MPWFQYKKILSEINVLPGIMKFSNFYIIFEFLIKFYQIYCRNLLEDGSAQNNETAGTQLNSSTTYAENQSPCLNNSDCLSGCCSVGICHESIDCSPLEKCFEQEDCVSGCCQLGYCSIDIPFFCSQLESFYCNNDSECSYCCYLGMCLNSKSLCNKYSTFECWDNSDCISGCCYLGSCESDLRYCDTKILLYDDCTGCTECCLNDICVTNNVCESMSSLSKNAEKNDSNLQLIAAIIVAIVICVAIILVIIIFLVYKYVINKKKEEATIKRAYYQEPQNNSTFDLQPTREKMQLNTMKAEIPDEPDHNSGDEQEQ